MTRTERFWRWVRDHATQRIRDCHHHERLCPNCKQWSSVVGISRYRRADDGDRYDAMTCAGCGHESYWDMAASMLPVSVPEADAAGMREQRLRAALEPFAEAARGTDPVWADDRRIASLRYDTLRVKHLRAALKALS